MQHTFFSLLTNKKERQVRSIRISLDEKLIVGAPWFNLIGTKTIHAKVNSPTK